MLMSRLLLGATGVQSTGGPQRETAPLRGEGAGVLSPIACPSLIEDGSWGVNSLASVQIEHTEQPESALRDRAGCWHVRQLNAHDLRVRSRGDGWGPSSPVGGQDCSMEACSDPSSALS